jgi:nucleoside-diphosphate-sugar epimerase
MQTIIGSTGPIGTALARELKNYTGKIRLVSRNPRKVNGDDELFSADVLNLRKIDEAIEGSEVVYLTVGLEYKTKVWQKNWPVVMSNVITACKRHKAKLAFFDNMYMYDPEKLNPMTEETPIKPSSKKGAVRAKIADMLLKEVKNGNLTALIGRAADFISLKNSVLVEMGLKNLKAGKKADWFVDVNRIHNFTYVTDAARGMALLGNTPDAYNQVWHLPSINQRMNGIEWIDLMAKELKVKARYRVMPQWMMGIIGLFIPVVKEFREMSYQYEKDYYFDSSKFQQKFNYKPTEPAEAIREMIRELKQADS